MRPDGSLHVVRTCDHGVVTLHVVGEVDLSTRAVFDDAATAALSDLRPDDVLVIDLLEVTFIGSVGLNSLAELRARCASRAVSLRIVASGSAVVRPLRLSGLDLVLSVYEALPDAVGARLAR